MAVCGTEDLPVSTLPARTWNHRTCAFQVRMHETACNSGLRRTSRCAHSEFYINGTLTYELEAHSHAYRVTKILYRDISAENIILTDYGKGSLIDWELAKMMDEDGSRRPDRTVNYPAQYRPAMHSSRQISLEDMAIYVCKSALAAWQGAHAYGRPRVIPARPGMGVFTLRPCQRHVPDSSSWHQQQGHSEQGGYLKIYMSAAGEYPSSGYSLGTGLHS